MAPFDHNPSFYLDSGAALLHSCPVDAAQLTALERAACVSAWKTISTDPTYYALFEASDSSEELEATIQGRQIESLKTRLAAEGEEMPWQFLGEFSISYEKFKALKLVMGTTNAFRKIDNLHGTEPDDDFCKALVKLLKDSGITDPAKIKLCGNIFNTVLYKERDEFLRLLSGQKVAIDLLRDIEAFEENGVQKIRMAFNERITYVLTPDEEEKLINRFTGFKAMARGFFSRSQSDIAASSSASKYRFTETSLGEVVGPIKEVLFERKTSREPVFIVQLESSQATPQITVLNRDHLAGRNLIIGQGASSFTAGIVSEEEQLLENTRLHSEKTKNNIDAHLNTLTQWREALEPLIFHKHDDETFLHVNGDQNPHKSVRWARI